MTRYGPNREPPALLLLLVSTACVGVAAVVAGEAPLFTGAVAALAVLAALTVMYSDWSRYATDTQVVFTRFGRETARRPVAELVSVRTDRGLFDLLFTDGELRSDYGPFGNSGEFQAVLRELNPDVSIAG